MHNIIFQSSSWIENSMSGRISLWQQATQKNELHFQILHMI
jgi:hypothetical protein